jgi:hypothetical protein
MTRINLYLFMINNLIDKTFTYDLYVLIKKVNMIKNVEQKNSRQLLLYTVISDPSGFL